MKIAVLTTFGNASWSVYSQKMLHTFAKFWPEDVPLLVQLDDELLYNVVCQMLRGPQDAVACGWDEEHTAFVERNKDKDHPQDYRKQAVRFCHKVFALKRALGAVEMQKAAGGDDAPRYLIWMDADVITTAPVTIEDLEACLPKEGDAVSYIGRKDWDHSECGWLAFDLENGGDKIIEAMCAVYVNDSVFGMEQWHDSWVFDRIVEQRVGSRTPICSANLNVIAEHITNLTPDAVGRDVWLATPMARFSIHHKGPVAKNSLVDSVPVVGNNFVIQTKNAIPHEQICEHIAKNQELIKNWVQPCTPTDDEIVVVSAGPQLVAEDLRAEKGKKIVAVKHAIEPLRKAGITPWACILLDPRPHVIDFVVDADKDTVWFVASQVNPAVTEALLEKGCTVWGYHASVGAGEGYLTQKQPGAVIGGGSATATRGLYVLNQLGFKNFVLYGYDLCVPDKPDFNAKDTFGQPKWIEISLGMNDPLYNLKKCFWTSPELVAQYEEISDIVKNKKLNLRAVGDGLVPFIIKSYEVANLRNKELKDKIMGVNPCTCDELIYGKESNS